jgi:hypothetical protein
MPQSKIIFLTSWLMIAALMSLLSLHVAAQQRRRPRTKPASPNPALKVIHNPEPAFQSGEINVNVTGDENPIIRLQMTANGQSLVEFPAKDRIFKVNPADPDLVTIEDSPTKENDRYILLRTSKQFLPSPRDSKLPVAATTMLVQMTSGMVVTLLIYPTRSLEQVVHRCVVRYDRDAIVSARQSAGLAVNLDQREITSPNRPMLTVFSIAPPAEKSWLSYFAPKPKPIVEPEPPAHKPPAPLPPYGHAPLLPESPVGLLAPVTEKQLRWSKPQHGLRVAVVLQTLEPQQQTILVLVRNVSAASLVLAPAQPELAILTRDGKGRALQFEPLQPLKQETTHEHGLLAPGETARFLLVFATPILGAKQRLAVTVAHTQAADEPITVELR